MSLNDLSDDLKDSTDENLTNDDMSDHEKDDKSVDGHAIPSVNVANDTLEDENQFKEPLGSPSVIREEDSLSESASDGEPVDIDDALKEVGLKKDE